MACGNPASVPVAADAPRAALQKFRFEQDGLPARDYYVYAPGQLARAPRPLVVYLHGCNQSAPDVAIGTRWNELADAENFLVVYPEQHRPATEDVEAQLFNGNGTNCWNWFRPEHMHRDLGEPATIAAITREVIAKFDADPQRVFILGASAGAIMSATMAATYPELYAAIGILAGCGYPACTDPSGLQAAQVMAGRVMRLPLIIIHGSADEIAPLALGLEGLQQWLATNDWIDDGLANGSVPGEPAALEHVGLDESAIAGLGNVGEPCLRGSSSPCLGGLAGFEDSYPYSVAYYEDAAGRPLIEFWLIHGLTHNYPGGHPEGSFTDPLGPEVTRAAYRFFLEQSPR